MEHPRKGEAADPVAYLEHYPENGGAPQRIPLDRCPFRIGRSAEADYIIYSSQVSKVHAEITSAGGEYRLRDLQSTNGTFVNGRRVTDALLTSGDIVHFAHKEFRFGHQGTKPTSDFEISITDPAESRLPPSLIRGAQHLQELLAKRLVRIVFQPIIDLDTRATLGYEALGRNTHPELAELALNPSELFHLADQCRLAHELSRVLRLVAAKEAYRVRSGCKIFLNLHRSEKLNERLIASLREVQSILRSDQQMVIEVHEDMVADLQTMRGFRDRLKELNIGLAYDDFGAGQARLAELAEVPPDFIKLHMMLIRGIDLAQARRELVQALNGVITDLGVQLIAEGIERPEEEEVCRSLGCRYGQGYLFGRPQQTPLVGLT
jgi:EAL domain-containing protein (putative c-di-GMP-specific phosphodiesterase class I)